MPNAIAFGMLLIWPLVCVAMLRRMPLERGLIWCILGGYLLLPQTANFDLPLVPEMDKVSIPNISAFFVCIFVMGRKISIWPESTIAKVLVAIFVFGTIPTVLTNSDPILFGAMQDIGSIQLNTGQLPGLTIRDIFSSLINQVLIILPFLMARQYLSSETGLKELLWAMVIGALIYSVPSLIEIRISPQINIWVYGFFQHDFNQMMRQGGFRPIVFLPHALWLAFFVMSAVLAAASLSRSSGPGLKNRLLAAIAYLMVLLFLCKSLASMMYGIVLLPVVLLTSYKVQIKIAVAFATVAIIYPMLRNAGVIPVDDILAKATEFSAERGRSLEFRLNNEELLLERAAEKPWFGWGGWGRGLVRDASTGRIDTIPDGRWIIVFGAAGWVGYIAEMGLLATPLILLGRRMRALTNSELSPYVAAIALILAVNMVDMLLNATLIPFTWLCAGAVLGYVERLQKSTSHSGRRATFGGGTMMGERSPTESPTENPKDGRRTIL